MAIDPTWLKTNVYNIIMDGVSTTEERIMELAAELTGLTPPGGGSEIFGGNSGPIKAGPVVLWNGGAIRKSVDDFKIHHTTHRSTTVSLSNGKKRIIGLRKSGFATEFQTYLDKDDWKKYINDNNNYRHVVYDFTILQNWKSQPIGIYAPFDCKVVFTRGNPNSAVGLIGIGPAKGKTAIFLHIVPSTHNKSPNKQFPESVHRQLQKETLNKTFKKGQLIAYQGNWGADSTGTHLHVEAMTKADFDQYITELPTFYPQ